MRKYVRGRSAKASFVDLSTDDLSAFSLPSFAGGIAGVASGLPLGFQGGFPSDPLSQFSIAGLLLGFQRGLTSGSLGELRSGQGSSLTSFSGQLGGFSLSDTGIASYPDCVPCHPPLNGGGALGLRPRSGCPLQLGLLCIRGCAQAVDKAGVLGPVHLSLLRSRKRLLAQGIDGFRSALATPYSRAWTTIRLREAAKSPDREQHRRVIREWLAAQQQRRAAWLAIATLC